MSPAMKTTLAWQASDGQFANMLLAGGRVGYPAAGGQFDGAIAD
jgi:hypothetical protein